MELNEIKKRLIELPHEIFEQRKKVEEKRNLLAKDKLKLQVNKATQYLVFKSAGNKLTIRDLDSKVIQATEQAESDMITTEGNFRSALIKLESLVDEFDATRKLSNLVDAEIRSQVH